MKLLRFILAPFGILYWIITYLRNLLYDWGLFKSYQFQLPILAVGNLSVGGTGKTPHIEYLIRLLSHKRVATLSRGYGRNTKGYFLADDSVDASVIGDEPFQFFTKFKKILVAVSEDRKTGIEKLIKNHNPEVILLDDAFQHRKVKAGFYVLLTDYSKLFSDDFILPFGDLRESSSGKKRANLIIVTKCPLDISELAMQKIETKLQANVPVFFSGIQYNKKVHSANDSLELKDLGEKLIVTGIANPFSFLNEVKNEGDSVLQFSDHHNFKETEINTILLKANGRKILTTEKDYMRLRDKISPEQLYYLPIEVKLLNEEERFKQMILNYVG